LKLIVQIPAFNEEATIAQTLRDIPKRIDGISQLETLLIDDGSTDRTVETARKAGITHVVSLKTNKGLASAFVAGIDAALRLGADIIVNTDADNQYAGADIALLVAPILRGTAEVTIGDRQVSSSPHMSPLKRLLQRMGSTTVSIASGVHVPDVTSGFRAFSREAALQINVFNPFTYTLETIIQSGNHNLGVQSVAVRTNAPTRPSRLYRGVGTYLRKSMATIFRTYALYKPLKTFFAIGAIFMLLGVGLGGRFLYHYAEGDRGGHIQSLILAAIFLIVGFQTLLIGLVADLISVNRRLSEEILLRLKRVEMPSQERTKPPVRERNERPERVERVAEKSARPDRNERPARRDRPERPERTERPERVERTPAAAPASPAAETQWVWLLDEGKLAGLEDKKEQPKREKPAPRAESKPEPRAEVRVEPKPEQKPESRPEARPEARPERTPRPATDRPSTIEPRMIVEADEHDDFLEGDDEGDELTPDTENGVAAATTEDGRPAGRRRRRRRGGMRHRNDLPGNRGKHLTTPVETND
jgi:glycosyltransferase involved in cell wall biosynthesis